MGLIVLSYGIVMYRLERLLGNIFCFSLANYENEINVHDCYSKVSIILSSELQGNTDNLDREFHFYDAWLCLYDF